MKTVTLDHLDNIAFDGDNPPFDNYHAFSNLRYGLYKLASEIRELEVQKQSDKKGPIFSLDFTSNPVNNLLVCYFDWFSISVSNYVRLVGLFNLMVQKNWKSKDLQSNANEVKQYCSEYAKKVIPEIQLWRNKVSAHFAATDPIGDTLGTIELTVFSFVTYVKPYFEVGGANFSTQGESSEFKRWSVTETYDILTPRFWPDQKITAISKDELT